MPDKYVIFKKEDWQTIAAVSLPGEETAEFRRLMVDDGVVIRCQDVFAAPALDAYANAIHVAIDILKKDDSGYNVELVERLTGIADYFHEMAEIARDTWTKIPD